MSFNRKRVLGALASSIALVAAGASPALAATTENWAAGSPYFHTTHGSTGVVSVSGASDGKALKLTLPANPSVGPGGGPEISTNAATYRYGTYGTRMRMADCSGQNRVGVVTGTFTYSTDHADVNRNGLPDNDEIDIEVLCAQPYVLWLTIWTDYRESDGAVRKISRVINLRTGQILANCYSFVLSITQCQPPQPGENTPSSVIPVPDFNASTQFRTYMFDWQPNRITFWGYANGGAKNVLWDYTGPSSRIPKKPGYFMQNVWHTDDWPPMDGPGTARPTAPVPAYIDSTTTP